MPSCAETAAVEQAVRGRLVQRGGAEDADEQRADQATDQVDRDDVERVVEAEAELDRDAEGADRTGDDPDREGADRVHVGTGRGDRDEAGDGTRGGTERGRLAVTHLLDDQPADDRGGRGQRGRREGDRRRSSSAPSDEPALKPYQPNHSRLAPRSTNGSECGRPGSRGQPRRLPSTIARARPAAPALMWTAVPPAKSRAPSELAIQPPVSAVVAVEGEHPVGDGEVDDRRPEDDEDAPAPELRPLRHGTRDQGRRDDREHQLEHREGEDRDLVGVGADRVGRRGRPDPGTGSSRPGHRTRRYRRRARTRRGTTAPTRWPGT